VMPEIFLLRTLSCLILSSSFDVILWGILFVWRTHTFKHNHANYFRALI
jgi:hypothetical protein